MPEQMIKVEVPEGWEAVAYRCPKNGDSYMISSGEINTAYVDFTHKKFIIVRKVWEWPKWLLAPWIAMDRSDAWYSFIDEPVLSDEKSYWSYDLPIKLICSPHSRNHYDFTPPPCDDWKESKRRNPHLPQTAEPEGK